MTCHAVAAATNGDGQVGVTREREGRDHVFDVERTRDERGLAVEHAVERGTRSVEGEPVIGSDHRPAVLPPEIRQRQLFGYGHAAS
jgi:hypothetical protein